MIDPRLLRDDFETTVVALGRRGLSRDQVTELAELEAARRELVSAVDDARAEQGQASKSIGKASPDERPAMIERAAELKAATAALEERLATADEAFTARMVTVPNFAEADAPPGHEGDGIVLRTVGERPSFDFEVKDHVDIMEAAGALELERAAKVSGARFSYLIGDGAILEMALVRYAMDIAMGHGHVPVRPPDLVRREALFGSGFLPGDEQSIFRMDERDELYLTGTSEVTLAGLHMGEILDDLPIRYAAFSPCFRREAGAYGRDTRGIFRLHQFDKVEMFSFVKPEDALAEHQRLLGIEEEIFGGLELHYQVVDIPIGDLGNPAARKYDIEAWLPGQEAFREVTSTSNTTDYQARRLNTRYRTEDGSPALVNTLNGTAVAISRAIIAVVETHQQADGTVKLPAKLVPYMGKETIFA